MCEQILLVLILCFIGYRWLSVVRSVSRHGKVRRDTVFSKYHAGMFAGEVRDSGEKQWLTFVEHRVCSRVRFCEVKCGPNSLTRGRFCLRDGCNGT